MSTTTTTPATQPIPVPATEKVATPTKRAKLAALKKFWPVAVALVVGAIGYWVYGMWLHESTDDAFVTAHVHTISARVQGAVMQVLVDDNQRVKKGQPLVVLDSREYEAAVKNAQAKFSKAHKDLGRMTRSRPAGGYDEEDEYSQGGFLPDEKPILDQYQADALSSEANLQTAVLHYQFTKLVAPEDGVIGKRSVETGQLVQPGQALMALVEPNPWIVANFKESQIANIRVKQEVEISIDAIPDHEFKGHVESIAPGSGSTFSLLPPDNATGNFTKVVQRIPVKITLDADSVKGNEDRLVPGMSSDVKIRVH